MRRINTAVAFAYAVAAVITYFKWEPESSQSSCRPPSSIVQRSQSGMTTCAL